MEKKFFLLDCTIRDGSYALEGAKKFKFKNRVFSKDNIIAILKNLCSANIDIVELGTVEHREKDKTGYAIYESIEEISKNIPKERKHNQLTSVFFRGPDIPMDVIPEYRDGLCDIIRLSIRYSQLDKSLEYCKLLCEKGYKVSIQPAITMRYSEEELDRIIQFANDMGAFSVYIVDTYGYMEANDISHILKKMDNGLNKDIRIGFHAHNNLNSAIWNSAEFLKMNSNHDIILDTCCMGMGQGAGNLNTELIVPYINNHYNRNYQLKPIIENCGILQNYWEKNMWGYSTSMALTAIFKIAYGYALALEFEYGYSLTEIYEILSYITDDAKYRYTKENLCNAINQYNLYKESGRGV